MVNAKWMGIDAVVYSLSQVDWFLTAIEFCACD